MNGVTYVIVVAIEDYHNEVDFPKVNFANKDAEDLVAALKGLGYDEGNFVVLTKEKPTRTSITQQVKKITQIAQENDRIIFYFAGHGFYEGGKNLLAPVDAIKTAKPETCIAIDTILGYLKNSRSKQKILFLDCCHSGFEAGEDVREGLDNFMADELIYQFSREEFCVGFASCKSNQKSISHGKLKNGVWSHYLVKALTGEADGIYLNGLLFSDKLQGYLNKETQAFVGLNLVVKREQTPIKFGSETDTFIIADLNPIFEERYQSRVAAASSLAKVFLESQEVDTIKTLPGFQRGFHKVPGYISSATKGFVKEKGAQIIKEDIESLSENLKSKLNYKRAEINSNIDVGSGSIQTKDFDYSVEIAQSTEIPQEYIITRRLENIQSDVFSIAEANNIFDGYFDSLVFNINERIDIIKLIDAIEALEDSLISVKYNPANMDTCTISIEGMDYDIEVSPYSFQITTDYNTSPNKLITAYQDAQKAIMAHNELKMLS